MTIDWVTVLAQLANFLLLAWLLRRFLFRPILAGIDAREAEIARRLAAAEAARAQALAAEQRFQQQYEHSVAEQDKMVANALQATKTERDQLLSAARSQLEEEQKEWHRQLELERVDFLERLQRAGALTLSELTRKILHDLADAELEAAIARQLGQRLAPMAMELRGAAGGKKEARITTHTALSAESQAAVRAELSALLPELEWQFVMDAEQAHGLTIEAGGAHLAWTIDSYMDEFERLLTQNHPASASLPAPTDEH